MSELIEAWRKCWREGFGPNMSDAELAALYTACDTDDPRLLQGRTVSTIAGSGGEFCGNDLGCEAVKGCATVYPFIRTNPGCKRWEALERFEELCRLAALATGEEDGCRYFLNWWDDCDRTEGRRELMAEIRLEHERRETAVTP